MSRAAKKRRHSQDSTDETEFSRFQSWVRQGKSFLKLKRQAIDSKQLEKSLDQLLNVTEHLQSMVALNDAEILFKQRKKEVDQQLWWIQLTIPESTAIQKELARWFILKSSIEDDGCQTYNYHCEIVRPMDNESKETTRIRYEWSALNKECNTGNISFRVNDELCKNRSEFDIRVDSGHISSKRVFVALIVHLLSPLKNEQAPVNIMNDLRDLLAITQDK